jgi:hypothetical protein
VLRANLSPEPSKEHKIGARFARTLKLLLVSK